jgi:LysM repeat protein
MSTKILTLLSIIAAFAVSAQQTDARAAYQQQQAVQEVQRLAQQFDQMESNFESLTARMTRLESGNSAADLRAEISGIKAQIAEIKREQANMRREIVAEISQKMAGLLAQRQPPPPPPPAATPATHSRPAAPKQPTRTAPEGPYYEHVVEPGQTLSLIAKGYDTTVPKILAANPTLKPNSLRVGQKIIVPAEDKK